MKDEMTALTGYLGRRSETFFSLLYRRVDVGVNETFIMKVRYI